MPCSCSATETARGPGTLRIWRFSDGKAGHDNQSLGLIEALAERRSVEHRNVPLLSDAAAARAWLSGRCRALPAPPSPHLLIGAGRRCHPSLLAAGRVTRAATVVLMRPSLPLRLFDLAIIPRHDGVAARPGVLLSEGMLNRVRAPAARDQTRGLILIGGPSRHYRWAESDLLRQIDRLLEDGSVRTWDIADSRRTPARTRTALAARAGDRIRFHPHASTAPAAIAALLGASQHIWVSEDSMSMCYEALSGGGRVGLLEIPRRRSSRPTRSIDQLLATQRVVRCRDWALGIRPRRAPPLDEARRCAALILSTAGLTG